MGLWCVRKSTDSESGQTQSDVHGPHGVGSLERVSSGFDVENLDGF